MTTTRDQTPENRPGKPVSYYMWGAQNAAHSRALTVDFIDSGVDSEKDCVTASRSNSTPTTFPGDNRLALNQVQVVRLGSGEAWRYNYYKAIPNTRLGSWQVGDQIPAAYDTFKIVLDWYSLPGSYSTLSATSNVLNSEYDPLRGASIIVPWKREIWCMDIIVNTILPTSPAGAMSSVLGKINSNSFEIDGVTYAANTLLAVSPQVKMRKYPTGDVDYLTQYHWYSRPDGWIREYLSSATIATAIRMYETATFAAVPYKG